MFCVQQTLKFVSAAKTPQKLIISVTALKTCASLLSFGEHESINIFYE